MVARVTVVRDCREMMDARKMAEQADKTGGYGFKETIRLVFAVRTCTPGVREADRRPNHFCKHIIDLLYSALYKQDSMVSQARCSIPYYLD